MNNGWWPDYDFQSIFVSIQDMIYLNSFACYTRIDEEVDNVLFVVVGFDNVHKSRSSV